MAGERLAKLTLTADWNPVIFSGTNWLVQTKELRFLLEGQWETFGSDGWNPRAGTPFNVPFPTNDPAFSKTGMSNLAQALREVITARKLPYVVSEVREVGRNPSTNVMRVEFDVAALDYDPRYDLDFISVATPTGWSFVNQRTVRPLVAKAYVQDATIFGSATGAIQIDVTAWNIAPFTYVWADDPAVASAVRLDVRAGTYVCTVADRAGASTTLTVVVKSDPQLLVQVLSTATTITLVPSGGLPGYTFLWDDGSTLATRTGLVPGTYDCTVTDARGATRDVSVRLAAYQYYWSGNPITLSLDAGPAYRLDPTTKPNLSFLCQVWLEKEYLSGTYEPVGVLLEQPADAGGRTTFEVQRLLAAYLEPHVPAPGLVGVELARPLFRRFFLQHSEQFGAGTPVPGVGTSLDPGYVVLGGLNFYEAQARTWFSYQLSQRPFLTWEPARKHVLPDQPEYLYYMPLAGGGDFAVQVRVAFDDGTDRVDELPGSLATRDFEVYCLATGYQALDLGSLVTTQRGILWWEVCVVTPGGGLVLSEVRRYVLDKRTFPRRRYFLFATSLGGMATYPALGEAQTDVDVTGEESVLSLPPGYDPLAGDVAVQARSLRPVLKVAAGKRTQGQLLASQDLLLSRRVLLLLGQRWVPGYLKAKTSPLLDESKRVLTQEFEFILPTEQHYTPSL
jgi:hypothetical protein